MSNADLLKRSCHKLASSGFFHIFGASTINKVLTALLSIVLVRMLSKMEYGAYTYAFNIASFFVLFNGLGASSALLQLCSEAYKDRALSDRYYAYGTRAGIAFDALLALAIVLVGITIPLAVTGSNGLLILLCLYPFATLICELKLTKLRVEQRNKDYALMTNAQTVCLVVFSILGAAVFDAAGLIVGQYIALGITYGTLCIRCSLGTRGLSTSLSGFEKREFWGIALVSTLNNGLSQALTLVGTFFVGVLLGSAELVASYKVATIIPYALLFMPAAIVTYIYPYFARRKDDRAWSLARYRSLILTSGLVFSVVTIVLIVFAQPILALLFGEQYLDVTPAYSILMVGFFITASFRQPTGNLLVTQRRLKFNFLVGLISILANIILSLALIPVWGMVGAALAYTATMAIGAVLSVPYYIFVAGQRSAQRNA